MTILVTGGAGFIGSNFVLRWLEAHDEPVVNLDSLSYAGNLANLAAHRGDSRHIFVHGSINDRQLVERILADHAPRAILNFAAESHVDRSIHDSRPFFETNVLGTLSLLDAVRTYLAGRDTDALKFIHVSTDEVFGTLGPADLPFRETTPYRPNSPYSASKASSDHVVRAYHETFGLHAIVTNCSNNYGPRQFPEKLIPLMIMNAISGRSLPVYGNGLQIRDWLHVDDHCAALELVINAGVPGSTYNIGGDNQIANIDVVRMVCAHLDLVRQRKDGISYFSQVQHVADRPGHDTRYAVDTSKIRRELGWRSVETFEKGLKSTINWYLANPDWVENVISGAYRDWLTKQYQ